MASVTGAWCGGLVADGNPLSVFVALVIVGAIVGGVIVLTVRRAYVAGVLTTCAIVVSVTVVLGRAIDAEYHTSLVAGVVCSIFVLLFPVRVRLYVVVFGLIFASGLAASENIAIRNRNAGWMTFVRSPACLPVLLLLSFAIGKWVQKILYSHGVKSTVGGKCDA